MNDKREWLEVEPNYEPENLTANPEFIDNLAEFQPKTELPWGFFSDEIIEAENAQ